MKYKIGFLKLRFTVEKGSRKEKIIKSIIKVENNIKLIIFKILILFKIKHKDIHKVNIFNQQFSFYDVFSSSAYKFVVTELERDAYYLSEINFKENDIVIDIGGNIGVFGIYLAKKYPFLKIYSFEPCKENYDSYVKNIKINNIKEGIITVFNKAVTMDSRDVVMNFDYFNSGASKIKLNNNKTNNKNLVKSTTLDDIMSKVLSENNKDNIKLLKIDCEFSEYEILENTNIENLKKISYIRGEFHEREGSPYDALKLEKHIKQYVPNTKIEVHKEW